MTECDPSSVLAAINPHQDKEVEAASQDLRRASVTRCLFVEDGGSSSLLPTGYGPTVTSDPCR
ncbi:unnamed protein product, partial [Gadus morhua 'NCC']